MFIYAVKFTKAIKVAKTAANGQPILSDAFISDSDRILGRGLRKAALSLVRTFFFELSDY
jgi:hypothetical protein